MMRFDRLGMVMSNPICQKPNIGIDRMQCLRAVTHIVAPPACLEENSDYVCIVCIGAAGGLDGGQPNRIGAGNNLDTLDHQSTAVPEDGHLVADWGFASDVGQETLPSWMAGSMKSSWAQRFFGFGTVSLSRANWLLENQK